MTLKDLMTAPVITCRSNASLGEAARLMLDENRGCLPIVDGRGQLAGILTDRDVCLAVARHSDPAKTAVREVMTRDVVSCREDDPLETALVAMKQHQFRRIPVVNSRGRVKGLISIDDAIRNTGLADGRLPAEAIMDVLRHICTPEYDLLLAR
jgi:CBS domain-containing protein